MKMHETDWHGNRIKYYNGQIVGITLVPNNNIYRRNLISAVNMIKWHYQHKLTIK